MKRRNFIKTLGFSSMALSFSPYACQLKRNETSKLPNIIIVLADDMGWGDPHCYNPDSRIPTPNMDRLAREGIRFTDAHSPSAVCTPTRYSLLTGRYAWRTWLKRGVVGGYTPCLIEPGRETLATMLKRRGYVSGFFGKWHLGLCWTRMNGFTPTWKDAEKLYRGSWQDAPPVTGLNADFSKPVRGGPTDHGFDRAFFTAACSTIDGPFTFISDDRVTVIPDRQVSEFYDMTRGEEGSPRPGWIAPGFVLEEVDLAFTREAIAFMERCQAGAPGRPFFIELALSAPHTPWLPPDFVKGKSGDGPRGDLVYLSDWCLGEILKTLDRLGIAGDTLVIMASDNGPHPGIQGHQSSGPWRGYKTHIWEGGHRIPFIARWPGRIKAGTISSEPICLTDLMATLSSITGAEMKPEAGPDSYDISPALLGKKLKKPIREALVYHSENGTFAIQQGEWKLILDNETSGGWMPPSGEPPKPGTPGQLYNLARDPYEENNLWDKHPEIVARLSALLEKYKREGRSAPLRHR